MTLGLFADMSRFSEATLVLYGKPTKVQCRCLDLEAPWTDGSFCRGKLFFGQNDSYVQRLDDRP